jgi:glycosyltransferase involved in cell wall biosynthesis
MTQTPVSILICTYNRAALLTETLNVCIEQTRTSGAEIIVVDNNSTDTTAAVLSVLAAANTDVLRVFHEPQQGLSHARNRALVEARGQLVIFLDDDAIPHPGWLAALCAFQQAHPDVAAFGGRIIPRFQVSPPGWFVPALHPLYSLLDEPGNGVPAPFIGGGYPFGANMAFNRSVSGEIHFATHLGRIGSSLLSGEETLVFNALRAKGQVPWYVPGAVVDHVVPPERLATDWLYRRFRAAGQSEALLAETRHARLLWLLRGGFKALKAALWGRGVLSNAWVAFCVGVLLRK